MKYNTLEEALRMDESYIGNYKLPFRRSDVFRKDIIDLEYFNMSFFQRIVSFFVCLALALISFFYSLFNIIGAVISPSKFAFPYAFSNFLFFVMFGFLFGFKTYSKRMFSEKKRGYALAFMSSTFLTLYASIFINSYFVVLLASIIQIFTFFAFVIAFLPGGTNSMSSFASLILNR